MCAPDQRYRSIAIISGVLNLNGNNRSESNRKVSADADFTLSLSKIRQGSIHHLIITKTIPGDVVITTAGTDMVLGEGLGAAITLSGAADTKYQLVITNDGTVNCIRPLASSVDLSGYATIGDLSNKLDSTVNIQVKDSTVVAYTLDTTDNATVIRFQSSAPVSVLLPATLPVGFNVGIIQNGTGQITLTSEAGGAIQHRQGHTKTAGQFAPISLLVVSNTGGNAARYNLGGDTAA